MRAITLSALVISIGGVALAQAPGDISVVVSGVRNDTGLVRCGLYNSPNGFREPGKEFKGAEAKISGGKATCLFNAVPPGTYAVAVFHAEHGETKLETGMFGKPKQGYGFTRDATGTMGPPSFTAAAYAYPGGNSSWPINLQY
jgi:uncharacterized protein (DUF2141 family)